jgi:hypothetical protein
VEQVQRNPYEQYFNSRRIMRIMWSLNPVRRLSVDGGAGTEKPLRTVFQYFNVEELRWLWVG